MSEDPVPNDDFQPTIVLIHGAWADGSSWNNVTPLLRADNIITPAQQQMMAERAKSTVTRVDAGHLSMISHPDAVADVIREAATH